VLLPQLARRRQLPAPTHRKLRGLVVALVSVWLTCSWAIGLLGGVPNHPPMIPTIETQMASSFVNRADPGNVAAWL
jgi:hypothetical protein